MPCREWFAAQPRAYRESVLPPSVRARVSVEAAVGQGWRDVVGDAGRIVSIEHYGASADYQTVFREFGFTADAVATAARESLRDVRSGDVRPGGVQRTSAPTTGGTGDLPA
jgi:transketolase